MMERRGMGLNDFDLLPLGLRPTDGKQPTLEQWLGVGDYLRFSARAHPWWVGDWYNYGKGAYSERYSQALTVGDGSGLTAEVVQNYGWVAAAFEISSRDENLPFHVHRMLLGVPEEERLEMLRVASREHWTTSEAASRVRERKRLPSRQAAVLAGKFRVVYADPPWAYRDSGGIGFGKAEEHYATRSVEEISSLPVRDHVCDDAVLFLWVTSPLLAEVWPVVGAWGFEYKASLVWDKGRAHPVGHYVRCRHELLLVCVRGSCTPDRPNPDIQSIQFASASDHSAKPERFAEIIQELYDGPYLELFARVERPGWTSWGDQLAHSN